MSEQEKLTREEWLERQRLADEAEAAEYGLSVDELRAARSMNMHPGRYKAMRGVRNIDEFDALEREVAA